jgi:hypothetical protein
MTINNSGNTTGKLKIAIRDVLFAAFEAMPEFIVSIDANPMDPKSKFRINKVISLTGLPSTSPYIRNPTKPIPKSRSVLYNILDRIIAVGFDIE